MISPKKGVVMATKQKIFRVNEEIEKMFLELKAVYQARSENHLFELLIQDIYKLKKSKALIPFEELDKRDKELKQAFFELGRLKQSVDEKEKRIEELNKSIEIQKKEQESKKGFWARLFGL
jgi:HPt (histidine-containing phosphotransfer) domain-containing protein